MSVMSNLLNKSNMVSKRASDVYLGGKARADIVVHYAWRCQYIQHFHYLDVVAEPMFGIAGRLLKFTSAKFNSHPVLNSGAGGLHNYTPFSWG